ncbi:MAG: AAA family ATPase [Actinoplanes sp.]
MRLIITRGLPGSGKTTLAKAWVAEDPATRTRINRDDSRNMMHGGRLATDSQERQVTVARDASVAALLRKGWDVICDDTSLPNRHARDLRRIALLAGAEFEVWDLTDVPIEECLRRNQLRAGTPAFVPEDVICNMYQRFISGKAHPLPLPDEPEEPGSGTRPYAPLPGTPTAVMVDIDGTVALMGDRSPFDETLVHLDRANQAVIAAVRAMHAAGHAVIFCSGRTAGCRDATEKWLAKHVAVPYEALHMRAVGDTRKDSIIKVEIFDREIRDRWNVLAVFDDRRQVVDAWRAIGLTVFQVAPGDF